jgi:hypothetical protein
MAELEEQKRKKLAKTNIYVPVNDKKGGDLQ